MSVTTSPQPSSAHQRSPPPMLTTSPVHISTSPRYSVDSNYSHDSRHAVDLGFLTNQERAALLKVIKADMELKKVTLEKLKKSIEEERQYQVNQKSTMDPRGKCACCGMVFRTYCDRRNAKQCLNCKHLVCKKCKRLHNGNVMCPVCIKERLLKLQSMDYFPVFHISVPSNGSEDLADGPGSGEVVLYGSELLKKSLESHSRPGLRKGSSDSVDLGLPPQTSLSERRRSTLTVQIEDGIRSRTLTPVPSIGDADCGFKLIRKAESEEHLSDLCSLYSEPCDPEDYDIKGKIMFGIWYRADDQQLYIRVSEAENLAAAKDGTSDPYVKTYLLPGQSKQMKRRTGIQRSTTKPNFDELLKYKITREEVGKKILWLSVWDWDRYGRNMFLGEVRQPISSFDLTDSSLKWYDLKDMKEEDCDDEVDDPGFSGRLLLSLKYEPNEPSLEGSLTKEMSLTGTGLSMRTTGKLLIHMKQAEGLRPRDPSSQQINPFARCYLLPNRFVDSKKKSSVAKNTINPVWDTTVEYYNLSMEDLESSRVLEVTVWDADKRGVNEFIGGVRIGPDPSVAAFTKEWMDSVGDELTHWDAVMSRPGEWVEQWHKLRPTMDSMHLLKMKARQAPRPSLGQETSSSIEKRSDSWSSTPHSSRESSPKKSSKAATTDSVPLPIKRAVKGDYDITGEILLTTEYKDGEVMVHIEKAMGIAAANKNGTSDSYAKTYLLPDKSKESKRKTDVQKKTVDPLYDTTVKYKVPFNELGTRAIWLTIWNHDLLGTNLFLGEVCIPLTTLDLKHPKEKWYKLKDFSESGIVIPTAPVHIEQDLLARSPSPHRKRSAGMTASQLRSKSPLLSRSVPALNRDDSLDSTGSDGPTRTIAQVKRKMLEDSFIPIVTISDVEADVHEQL